MLLDHRSLPPYSTLLSQPIPESVFLSPHPFPVPAQSPLSHSCPGLGLGAESRCHMALTRARLLPVMETAAVRLAPEGTVGLVGCLCLKESDAALAQMGCPICQSPNRDRGHQLHKQSHPTFVCVGACMNARTHTEWGMNTGSHLSLGNAAGTPLKEASVHLKSSSSLWSLLWP